MFQVVGDDQNNTEIQTISTKSSMSHSFVSKDLWGKMTNVEFQLETTGLNAHL